jgi:hypothetical protein
MVAWSMSLLPVGVLTSDIAAYPVNVKRSRRVVGVMSYLQFCTAIMRKSVSFGSATQKYQELPSLNSDVNKGIRCHLCNAM